MSACRCSCACGCTKCSEGPAASTAEPPTKFMIVVPPAPITHVFVVVTSMFARPTEPNRVYSGYRDARGEWVILGADQAWDETTDKGLRLGMHEILLTHMTRVRSMPRTRDATIVLISPRHMSAFENFLMRFGVHNVHRVFDDAFFVPRSKGELLTKQLCEDEAIRTSMDFVTLRDVGVARENAIGVIRENRIGNFHQDWLRMMVQNGTTFLDDDKFASER